MQTSGLVLDVYDDVHGDVIRGLFSSLEAIPNLLKQAQDIGADRNKLPDDAFALVLVNGEERLRKYACLDAGNTALSVFYFLENGHKLPDEAQKVAAENLITACGWYDITVPAPLEKVAAGGVLRGALGTGLGAAQTMGQAAAAPIQALRAIANPVAAVKRNPAGALMTAAIAPSFVGGARQNAARNMAAIRAGEAAGGAQGGLQALEHAKLGEASGTSVMPLSADPNAKPQPTLAGGVKKASKHLAPVVDVSTQTRTLEPVVKQASHYCRPSVHKYPIDSFTQVKQAADYFQEYGKRFQPVERREYCENLVKRASTLGVELPPVILKYGSSICGSDHDAELFLQNRGSLVHEPELREALHKLASSYGRIPPTEFAELVSEFDKLAGIDHLYDEHVLDPYYCAFGVKLAEDDTFLDLDGNEQITGHELKSYSRGSRHQLEGTFGADFADEFQKDPVAIYKSMPIEQKRMIRRMATDNAPGISHYGC